MFATMDLDGDGEIDEQEGVAIGRMLAGGDAAKGKVFWDELLAAADTDDSGTVSREEYLAFGRKHTDIKAVDTLQLHLARLEEATARRALQSHRLLSPVEQATRVFKFLDTDGDGRVSLTELTKLAESDEQELLELPQLFTIMDSELFQRGDGALTLKEWLAFAEDMPELREERIGKALAAQLERAFVVSSTGPLDRAARAKVLFKELDDDSGGFIDLKEYIAGRTSASKLGSAAEADGAEALEEVLEAQQEFLWRDMESWGLNAAQTDMRLTRDEFEKGFLTMYADATDDEFEIACRKMALHRKKPADEEMRKARAKRLFDALDVDCDGYLTRAEVLALQGNADSSGTSQAQMKTVLPLFFEALDKGAGDSSADDDKLSLDEWSDGLLEALKQRTDFAFKAITDGMLSTLKERQV